ncbi:hypothetical protein ABPG75_004773 [Micractinium tetrahymenae]
MVPSKPLVGTACPASRIFFARRHPPKVCASLPFNSTVAEASSISHPANESSMPGAVTPVAGQRPLSVIDRVKSEKALAAAAAAAEADGTQTYTRGPKGEVDTDRLMKLQWTQELLAQPGMQTVLTCGAMSKAPEPGAANAIDPDHLFLSLLRQDLIRDLLFLWNPRERAFRTLMSVGMDVCGHPSIVHGGFTSAMIDETTGGLVYELKKTGELGEGSAFTARLEVDYKRPMPSNSDVICTARVEKVEGRKIWTVAEVADRPGGEVYAIGRALYVTPRSQVEKQQKQ